MTTKRRVVLVIGRHQTILEKVMSLLEQNGYAAIGAQTDAEALEVFRKQTVDAVIIGGGVEMESRAVFHVEFPKWNPEVKILDVHPQTVLSDLASAFQ